jgi:hypothetical protein
MDTVDERSTSAYTVSFFGLNGIAAVPTSVTYSTRCNKTNTPIKTGVSITPASVVTIILDSLDSTIQNTANQFEDKILTVRAVYATNDECNAEYEWLVKNLTGV